ncbi:MAG TPA: response regulator transcription factor [Tepidiformaceae bacterium]|nr:response regulator transcription factor [Tepidiformaceae bacterium]
MTSTAAQLNARNHDGPISVLLVDDHAVIRQALRLLLESRPEIKVVGDAENGRDAIKAVESLHPDVVLMDVVMPGLNGIEATRHIRRLAQASRVVMLSGFVDEDQLIDALRAGASGYLLKTSDIAELVLAIQTVHRGNTYYSSQLSDGFDLAELAFQAHRRGNRRGIEMLTGREREVLQLVAEGNSNQDIADQLKISIKTVEAHKAHITAKLHVRSRTDLVRYALQRGIVRFDSVGQDERTLSEPAVDDFVIGEGRRGRQRAV